MRRNLIVGCLLVLALIGTGFLFRRDDLLRQRERRITQQAQRYFEHELERSRDRPKATGDFDKSKLQGATLRRPGNAFQREDFTAAVLDDATLEAGAASFQLASFDKASLRNAKLVGGVSSFQGATFVGADLSAVHLSGNFQLASFENAILTRAKWSGSFQTCNISGAHFAGADLSEIDKSALESCYFTKSPTYRPDTKFPKGFDPTAEGWLLANE